MAVAAVARVSEHLIQLIPKISVCLPTYNRSRYLQEALTSILAQTFGDFEVIVADNCSTDSTPDVVRSFKDPRVRYIQHDENIGHYRNMNHVLQEARGEYVAIVHDDDVYAPEFLERESAILDRHPAVGMVHCAVYVVDPDRHPLQLHRVSRASRITGGVDEFMRYLGGHDVACSTVMCRRTVWQSAGPFVPEYMCADFLMWLNIAMRTDIAYIATPLAETRVHGNSMTSSMDPQRWYREFFEIVDIAITEFRRLHPDVKCTREDMLRVGAVEQSKRFFIAALAAAAEHGRAAAGSYIGVLNQLHARGAPCYYAWGARALTGPARPLLGPVRRVRRMFAKAKVAP